MFRGVLLLIVTHFTWSKASWMDETYDVIILGTGIPEIALSVMLVHSGVNVLHLDTSNQLGGDTAPTTALSKYLSKYNIKYDESTYGKDADWIVNPITKIYLEGGRFDDQVISKVNVEKFVERRIWESRVYENGTHTSAVDYFKKKLKNFVPEILKNSHNVSRTRLSQIYNNYGFDHIQRALIRHFLDLPNDNEQVQNVIRNFRLFNDSSDDHELSYFHPIHGLSSILHGYSAFAKKYFNLTLHLNTPIDKIRVDASGKVTGVTVGDKLIKGKRVICSPSFAPDRTKKIGDVVRAVLILKHDTSPFLGNNSGQMLLRSSDENKIDPVYLTLLNRQHGVAPEGFAVATVSTTVETGQPENEINFAIDLFGNSVLHKAITVTELLSAKDTGTASQIFVTNSYDGTSDFGKMLLNLADVYAKATSKGDEPSEETD